TVLASALSLSFSCTPLSFSFFFFSVPAPPEIYTLSLHDALPIYGLSDRAHDRRARHPCERRRAGSHSCRRRGRVRVPDDGGRPRSEEHTSELQSRSDLVCRLLLEKKKKKYNSHMTRTCKPY